MKSILFSLSLLALLAGCSGGEQANQNDAPEKPQPRAVKSYTIEQFMNTVQFGGGTFSPDEKSLLVSSNETGIYNAYEMDLESGDMKPLTDSKDKTIRAISFFPEDKRFMYMADNGGNEIFHVYMQDLEGNVTDLTPWEEARSSFAGWSSDDKGFYIMSNKRNPQFMDMYYYSLETLEPEMKLQNDFGMQFATMSPNEQYVIFTKPVTTSASDMFLYNTKTGDMKQLTDCKGEINYSPQEIGDDNKTMYFTTDEGSEFAYLKSWDLETDEQKKIAEFNWDVWYAYHSEHERYRIIGVNADGKTELHMYDMESGKEISFPEVEGGEISGVRISESEQRMTFRVGSSIAPSDLYYHEIGTEEVRQLTKSLNPAIDAQDLVHGEVIRYKSWDGTEIPAILYKPHQATADNKMPAMLWIHGGPGGQSRLSYFPLLQYMVNQGYVVLAVNNRGSSGYGKTFFNLDNQNHGEGDLDDCVKAKDYLATLGYVDMDNVGILGGSYGGYMTMAALTFRPDEFKVGVDLFGVTNWLRTLNSIPPWWESFKAALYDEMGDPTTDSVRLYNISPLFHADKITKPFMVLQGAQDPRVLKVESDEIVEAARANGIDVEYVVFEDEGHGFVKKENEIEGYGKVVEFLDKHLKNTTTEANAAAGESVETDG